MPNTTKISQKIDLSPGALVHVGEQKISDVLIGLTDYSKDHYEHHPQIDVGKCCLFRETPHQTWINVRGLHEIHLLEKLGNGYGLHPLVLEDILNTNHPPKIEDFGDYLYITLKSVYLGEKKEIFTEQISIVLGNNFVLSFQETEDDTFAAIVNHLKMGQGRIRKMKIDYLAYRLIDSIIDRYFAILEELEERIEALEEQLLVEPRPDSIKVLYEIRREVVVLRRYFWPLREMSHQLNRGEFSLIKSQTMPFLRDLNDHINQVIDTVEGLKETLSTLFELYHTALTNRMNVVVKTLTIITTIFMPLTFLCGIYGMNFKHMPELEWSWGYPFVLFVMASLGLTMLFIFKKRDWI